MNKTTMSLSILLICSFFLQVYAASENQIELSILICTLEDRKESFAKIRNQLKEQIKANKLQDKVEMLYCCDNREHSIGQKRNLLLRKSRGTYVCYVDDDDRVHENYIKTIFEKLKSNPDCVVLTAVMTTNGKNPQLLIHSIKYKTWFVENGTYYRPPNHLTPIKSSIAKLFRFPPKNSGEDVEWSMAIARSGLIQTEEVIEEPYYFYDYVSNK
jgi:glycosyltransferase involved in cell wall biosynthesis